VLVSSVGFVAGNHNVCVETSRLIMVLLRALLKLSKDVVGQAFKDVASITALLLLV
jgi:hypothetical protein